MEAPRSLTTFKRMVEPRAAARWWFLIIGLFLWAGCSPAGQAVSGGAAPTPWVPPTVPPTATFTPVPSATPLPSPTPSPTPRPTPTPMTCWKDGGRIVAASLPTKTLTYALPVLVYLPPCYDALPALRYPVLYLIHGQSFSEKQWVRLGAPDVADHLIGEHQMPPFIIVMPGERSWEQPADSGWDEAFLDVLMPWVENNFRTLEDRRYRAIGGLSRGASWAIHLGLSHWELFGSIGGHSPPVFWEDVPHIRAWLTAIPADQRPRIYLDIGDGDQKQILSSARWFEDVLTQRNFPHEWHFNIGRHDEAYWRAHTEAYLRWYTADWWLAPP